MSDLWSRASVAAAARISAHGKPPEEQVFTPWSSAYRADLLDREADAPAPTTIEQVDDVRAAAFAEGFEQGRRATEEALTGEREALARLAAALEVLQPEAPHDLAAMLAETVERLVRQIVGEVSLDGDLLLQRASAVAALIAEDATPSRMRLHPDDHARLEGAALPVERVADPQLAPGTVLLEVGDGWIEDGPEVGLEKLRIALDRMGIAR